VYNQFNREPALIILAGKNKWRHSAVVEPQPDVGLGIECGGSVTSRELTAGNGEGDSTTRTTSD
jgi:hypothetical protein